MEDDIPEDIGGEALQKINRVLGDVPAHPNVKKPFKSRYGDQRKTKPCFYYISYGYCRYGRDCKFFHPRPRTTGKTYNSRVVVNSRYPDSKAKPARRASFNPCDYKIKEGAYSSYHSTTSDRNGITKRRALSLSAVKTTENIDPENTSFAVELKNTCSCLENVTICTGGTVSVPDTVHNTTSVCSKENSSSKLDSSSSKTIEPRATFQFLKFRKVHDLSNLKDDDLKKLRQSEISYLEKRFPKHKEIENDTRYAVECTYSEDPDWWYNGKPCILKVIIGEQYPKEVCEVEFVKEKHVLSSVLKTLNNGINGFLMERHKFYFSSGKVELVLSAFFKWLDVSFDDLFCEGLKKHETESLDHSQPERSKENTTSQSSSDNKESDSGHSDDTNDISSQESEVVLERKESFHYTSSESEDNAGDHPAKSTQVTNWIKSGTEVKLIYFELRESAAALECSKITVTVRCDRCKTLCETSMQAKQNWKSQCSKCRQNLAVIFHPVLLHPYSSVLGYLHLSSCQPVDLAFVQCRFQVTCLNCSKRCTVDGIHFGKPHITWCTYCNHKFSIAAEAVKFHQLNPSSNNAKVSHATSSSYENSKKKSRDPAFKEGKPLPNNGACKHYKKSHRWLRFPCCGKAYPCDLCHEENEDGHEMKFATRMICGFCSKEQRYGKDKACDSCTAILTKKSGAHWEGGKGCRDRIKMCRDDKHKYTGVSKTVSHKCGSPKKKKA